MSANGSNTSLSVDENIRAILEDPAKSAAAAQIIETCIEEKVYSLGALYSRLILRLASQGKCTVDKNFYNNYATCGYKSGDYSLAYDTWASIVQSDHSIENTEQLSQIRQNMALCVPHIRDRYAFYNPTIVNELGKQISNKNRRHLYTVTMTTCKRPELFKKAVDSFLNSCEDIDLISEWFVVDDNSSEDDRKEMKMLYPFITFYNKTPEEKGHVKSMNIIREHLIKCDSIFNFHMEDDFLYFSKRPFFTDMTRVLQESVNYGQCLINPGYGEIIEHIAIKGQEFKQCDNGMVYLVHEHIDPNEYLKKYGPGMNCAYWPHYSLRPGLTRVSAYRAVGEYSSENGHFERDYSYRYIQKGYKTCFLDRITSIHTGRLTSEKADGIPNAYTLNGEEQFAKSDPVVAFSTTGSLAVVKEDKPNPKFSDMQTHVINMDCRPDRMNTFNEQWEKYKDSLDVRRYSAVVGKELIPTMQLQTAFDTNDFNWRCGMIGCALSHMDLWCKLVNEPKSDAFYCVLEDDCEPTDQFMVKLSHMLDIMPEDADIVYLGHFYYPNKKKPEYYNRDELPRLEKWGRGKAMSESMGGTIGYLITKKGAQRMLEWINETGVSNGIDWVMLKAAERLNIYYPFPHIVFSECFEGDNHPDSDIQYSHDNLNSTDEVIARTVVKEFEERYDIKPLIVPEDPTDYDLPQTSLMWVKHPLAVGHLLETYKDTPMYLEMGSCWDPVSESYCYIMDMRAIPIETRIEAGDSTREAFSVPGGIMVLPEKYRDFVFDTRLTNVDTDTFTVTRMIKYKEPTD